MTTPTRISLTKAQSETETGKALLSLLIDITNDGVLSENEIIHLQAWLGNNQAQILPAISYLRETASTYKDTNNPAHGDKKIFLKAIEAVMPVNERKLAEGARRQAEASVKTHNREQKEQKKLQEKQEKLRNKPIGAANFMVAGTKFDGRPTIIENHLWIDDDVYLLRDINNKYSRNAVMVLTKQGYQIGFVPEDYAKDIAQLLDKDCPHQATVTKILGYNHPIPVIQCYFYRTDSDVTTTNVQAKKAQTQNIGKGLFGILGSIVKIVFSVFFALVSNSKPKKRRR